MVDATRSHNTIKKEGYILYISLSEKGMVEIFNNNTNTKHFKSIIKDIDQILAKAQLTTDLKK
jgi:CRISPR/Cas system-associated exonuclease Cas4 (RecB family)